MTTSGQYQLIQPASPFTPLPYGLDSVVSWQPDVDPHWQGGVMWEPVCGQSDTTLSPCVTGSGGITVPSKVATFEHVIRGARPFTVFSEVDCSAPGSWDRLQQYAAQGLTNSELHSIERTFWTGAAAGFSDIVYPNLTSAGPVWDGPATEPSSVLLQLASTSVTGNGVVLDVVEGLGRLEQALADCYDGVGVIHVPRVLIPALCAQYQVQERGGRLYTWNGNLIAAGGGYLPTRGPSGVAVPAGASWIFATGAVFGYRGQMSVTRPRDSLVRTINTLQMITERTVLLGWDCCLIAVLVTLGGEPAGVYNSST